MRIYCTILILLLGSFIGGISAENRSDSTALLPHETRIVEPLQPDKVSYESFKNDKQYDYYSFRPKDISLWERVKLAIWHWLMRNVDQDISFGDADTVLWIITGGVLIVLLVLLFIFKPSLFYINRRKKLEYKVEEEDIQGISFDKLIKDALAKGEYSEAIRWKYLYTLKILQDRELISWDINKTTNEYVREMKRPDLKSDFKSLSHLFLYVRYGNFEAAEDHYAEVETLSGNIIKRI